MDVKSYEIGKSRLVGKVKISGAKNSSLKLLTASILTDELVSLENFPNGLLDVKIHVEMLEKLGKKCKIVEDSIEISKISNEIITTLDWNKRSIRNTLLILGSLTARYGEAKVPLPGGCPLGDRKYDLHVNILESMGAKVWEEEGLLCTKVEGKLKGTDIFLPIRSTGATENAILCGSLAHGKATIWNPHIRPEVLDLVNMLNQMGADIKVFGQKCIEINGVDELFGVKFSVIPDNMEAITWVIGTAITNGDVEILNFPFEHLEVPMIFLRESGLVFYKGENSLIVRGSSPFPVEISTGPYPGINSDMQPLFAVFGSCSKGVSKIIDLRFPGRYDYMKELNKLGVDFKIEGDMLKITGGNELIGTSVDALDLRAGMALLLAGLVSSGTTIINNAWMIERGYENLEEKLIGLGVKTFVKKY